MADGVATSPTRRSRAGEDAVAAFRPGMGPASTDPPPVHAAGQDAARRRSAPAARKIRPLPPVNKRSFRLPEVVLGVLLVAGCALGAVLWQKSTSSTTTVVVAARSIPRGTVIGPDDLRGAQVGGETSAMIAGDSAHALLGKVALVDIGVDVPMTLTVLTDAAALGADEALTSMALRSGEFPPDLAANDDVRILVTGRPDATGNAVTSLLDEGASVWSVEESADGASTVVTVRGSLALATSIAAADATRLVRVEAG